MINAHVYFGFCTATTMTILVEFSVAEAIRPTSRVVHCCKYVIPENDIRLW